MNKEKLIEKIKEIKKEYEDNFLLLVKKIENYIYFYEEIDVKELEKLLNKESELDTKSAKLKRKLWKKNYPREKSGGFVSIKLNNTPIYLPSLNEKLNKVRKQKGIENEQK